MTMKPNGLCGRAARGRKMLTASAESSPWLMTPNAEAAAPSTLTSKAA